MTYRDGFERTVSDWLDEQAGRGAPGYLDDILTRTTRTRQRPWWSSLERWLPMQTSLRLAGVPRGAWTVLVVIGLVLAIGVAALAFGSRLSRPLPAPFGPAANGVILYSAVDGDIHALDPATSTSSSLITGSDIDTSPYLSPDGKRFIFDRLVPGLDPVSTMIANTDGTDVRPLTDRLSLSFFDWLAWSPDSTVVAVVGTVDDQPGIWTIGLDGTHTFVTSAGKGLTIERVESPQWRPNGRQIVFVGGSESRPTAGLYVVGVDGSGLQPIIPPHDGVAGPAQPALSPDGTRVAYSLAEGDHSAIHVVDLTTSEDRAIAYDGAPDDRAPHWSPDGANLVFERYSAGSYRLAIGSDDGGAITMIGPTHPEKNGGADTAFSPDGSHVLVYYRSDRSTWSLGVGDGSQIQLTSAIDAPATWQRLGE